jgi:hypothetical protein
MPKRVKQYGLALVGVGVAVGVIAPAVIAQGTDPDDFVQPASTVVQTSLKPGTGTTYFVLTIGPATVTSRCTASSTSGRTPAHGLVMAVKAMSFPYCTDSLGGRDIWKTTGVWHITFLDAPNDETTTEPNSGDRLAITIPIKGITITSTIDPRCTITVAPTAPAHVVGAYDDVNTLTVGDKADPGNGAPVPVADSSRCAGGAKTSTAHFTATYVLTPGVHDAS